MSDEREQVIAALRAAGDEGLTGSELWAAVQVPRSRRQALMTSLTDAQLVRAEGMTRARRYRLVKAPHAAPIAPDRGLISPIFSSVSSALFDALKVPTTRRAPVGYRRELLDAYQPNVTSYLGAELAARLNVLGRRLDSVAPAGTYARVIYQRFLIDLSWSSSRLEGNTYELLDTERLLEAGEPTEGKSAVETRMLLNHKEAIRFLVESPGELALDSLTVCNLHTLLAQDLLTDSSEEGRLRTRAVGIGGSTYIPLAVPSQIMECFNLILAYARAIRDPIECAFFLIVHLPYLQPFVDVNKRTARLAANIPMIIHNMSPMSFRDVSADDYKRALLVFYETQELSPMRELFAWAYERSCALYEVVEQAAPAPDKFRMRWHGKINDGLGHLVRSLTDEPTASPERLIEAWLRQDGVPEDAQPRLAALIITDLRQLHEGSYARARVSRAEFERWREVWRVA